MELRKIGAFILVLCMSLGILAIGPVSAQDGNGEMSEGTEAKVSLQQVADGLTHPIWIGSPYNGSERLYVVDQIGLVKVVENGSVLPEPFLNITDMMVQLDPGYDERGLLSIAFHPDFANNGKVYAFWTAPLREGAPEGYDHTNVVSEFTVCDSGTVCDNNARRDILMIDQPYLNHNGGQVLFGPDGYLYITTGDGGNANDVGLGHNKSIGNAQDLGSLKGKVLRIDVNNQTPEQAYGIPADNPFANGTGLPEIFAYGFRNPAFAAFDNMTGQLFVADAGQDRFEEVDLVVMGGNYGWRIKEGFHCFDHNNSLATIVGCASNGTDGQPLIDPIAQFTNSRYPGGEGAVVIGGALYRGTALPWLQGSYIFGTITSDPTIGNGSVFIATPPAVDNGTWVRDRMNVSGSQFGNISVYLMCIGTGGDGELYLGSSDMLGPQGTTGKVWKMVPVE